MNRFIQSVRPIAGRVHLSIAPNSSEYARLHPANCIDPCTEYNVQNLATFSRIFACHITNGYANANYANWRETNISMPDVQPDQFAGEAPVAYTLGSGLIPRDEYIRYITGAYERAVLGLPEIHGLRELYRAGTRFSWDMNTGVFSWSLRQMISGSSAVPTKKPGLLRPRGCNA